MALYITRPRRDEVRIGRGLPSARCSLRNLSRVTECSNTNPTYTASIYRSPEKNCYFFWRATVLQHSELNVVPALFLGSRTHRND